MDFCPYLQEKEKFFDAENLARDRLNHSWIRKLIEKEGYIRLIISTGLNRRIRIMFV